MSWAVVFVFFGYSCFYYTWKCAKLVDKKPLYYVFLSLIIPIVGIIISYSMLNSAKEAKNVRYIPW